MRSDQPSLDPGLERTLEREYKYQKYESMRLKYFVIVAFFVGLAVGVLSEVLRK